MTISTTVGTRLTIGQVAKTAFELAGLLHPAQNLSAADKQMARTFMDVIITELEVGGGGARAIGFYDLPLVVGTYRYSLPSIYVGVPGQGMYIPAGTADLTKASGESSINQIDREQWHMLTSKSATSSRPSQFFLERELDALAAWFWPVPAEAGTVRLQVQRMLANCDDDNATVDLEPFWMSFLAWELAGYVGRSKGVPTETWMGCFTVAQPKKRVARGKANQLVDNQMIVTMNARR